MLHLWECSEADTIRIINTCNVEDARKVLTQNKTLFEQLLVAGYRASNTDDMRVKAAMQLFFEGVDAHIAEPTNIEKNWDLNGVWTTHSDGVDNNMNLASRTIVMEKKKVS